MKEYVYIVSRYLGESASEHKFHFIGYFNGLRIAQVRVKGGQFDVGEDYVLAVKNTKCQKNILYAELVKSKKLFI